jgi:hypothetical protein
MTSTATGPRGMLGFGLGLGPQRTRRAEFKLAGVRWATTSRGECCRVRGDHLDEKSVIPRALSSRPACIQRVYVITIIDEDSDPSQIICVSVIITDLDPRRKNKYKNQSRGPDDDSNNITVITRSRPKKEI